MDYCYFIALIIRQRAALSFTTQLRNLSSKSVTEYSNTLFRLPTLLFGKKCKTVVLSYLKKKKVKKNKK